MAQSLAKVIADFSTSLAAALAVGATSATIQSATDDDGVALPSGKYFFTLDVANSAKEHIVCDLSGTALTNIKSVSRQGVETTGVQRAHRVGASVTITDFAHLKRIVDLLMGTTQFDSAVNLGYDGAPVGLTGNQFATIAYVLSVVSGGSVTFDQQIAPNQVSGEALSVNDKVYLKESDSRWYKADADLTATFDQLQLGIVKTAAAGAGVTIQIAISGPVSGFSGLTPGAKYYLSNTAGDMSTSPGTYSVFLGWALSASVFLFNPVLKTLPTQREKDAMAGVVGAPSSTNKFLNQDILTPSSTADQSQTTQNAVTEAGEANATTKKNKLAQSFIPTLTTLRGVKLYKSANTGTYTGDVTIALQADSAGSPSGSNLASVTIPNAAYNALAVGEFSVFFSSVYSSLVAGSLYWIVISSSTSDTSNHPNFGSNSAGGYASGSVKYNNGTDGWVLISTIDLYFKTLPDISNRAVQTGTGSTINPILVSADHLEDASSASTTLNNDATETQVYSKFIEREKLLSLAGIRLKAAGEITSSGGAINRTWTFRLKINGTTIVTATINTSNNNTSLGFMGEFVALLLSSLTSQANMALLFCQSSTAYGGSGRGTSAVDLTAGALVTLTIQMSAASSNSFTADAFSLELLK